MDIIIILLLVGGNIIIMYVPPYQYCKIQLQYRLDTHVHCKEKIFLAPKEP